MEKQAQKQEHEVALDRLISLNWGGVYSGVARTTGNVDFFINIKSRRPGWKVNDKTVHGTEELQHVSKSDREFILGAMEAMKRLDGDVSIKGPFDKVSNHLHTFAVIFTEAVEVFESTEPLYYNASLHQVIPEPRLKYRALA